MKVIDVLKKTKELDIKSLAAQLGVAQKPLPEALKKIGASYSEKEKSWVYDNVSEGILQQNIYDHVPKKGTKRNANQKVDKEEKQQTENMESQVVSNPKNKPTNKKENKQLSKEMKKVTYEIEEWLHDALKIEAIRGKKKVSDIVNEIIKKHVGEGK